MSVEQAILEKWSRYRPLTDLVPVESVWKGLVPQKSESNEAIGKPYVSLLTEDPESLRTSDNTFTTASLLIRIYAETEPEAESIAEEVVEQFDGLSGDWKRGYILDCKWIGTTREDDEDDGSWNLMATFAVTVSRRRRKSIYTTVPVLMSWATFSEADWSGFTEGQWALLG